MNLYQALGYLSGGLEIGGALLSGQPLSALYGAILPIVGTLMKRANLPEGLIQRAMKPYRPPGRIAGAVTKAIEPMAPIVKEIFHENAPTAQRCGRGWCVRSR